jgi:LemA protein
MRALKRIITGSLLVAALLAAPLYYIHLKNEISEKDELVRSSWAQVESVMQRRYELIPNLIRTTEAYMTHEKGIFESIAKYRAEWLKEQSADTKIEASNKLEGELTKFIAVSENYPELKASQNFSELNTALEGSENRVATERRRYNEAIRDYNSYVRKFPANLLNYPPRKVYFEAETQAKQPINNSF